MNIFLVGPLWRIERDMGHLYQSSYCEISNCEKVRNGRFVDVKQVNQHLRVETWYRGDCYLSLLFYFSCGTSRGQKLKTDMVWPPYSLLTTPDSSLTKKSAKNNFFSKIVVSITFFCILFVNRWDLNYALSYAIISLPSLSRL